MSEREARSRFIRVAEALQSFLDQKGLGKRFEEARALTEWSERVGPRISAVSEPLSVSSGVLVVAVRSSAWLMELKMMEREIVRRLNGDRARGRIRRIHFMLAESSRFDGTPGNEPGTR
jgi:predicted nucleic acid-binding Zn ribbon protein